MDCGKALYASEKVKEAVREHEENVQPLVPRTKAKIVMLGNSGVGKTSIIARHCFGDTVGNISTTIGASFVDSVIDSTTGEKVQLQLWDTAGQERFRCMVPMDLRNATACVIVYDIANRQSFDDIDRWVSLIQKATSLTDPHIVLLANKASFVFNQVVSDLVEDILNGMHDNSVKDDDCIQIDKIEEMQVINSSRCCPLL
ncbi:hypothetical protein WR25_06190 [Diploscapter pachys]|uniref:Uncharacterized protein n=1 Tax=Diploscapter pachys TaxID=2018661 RepID=A0A2A2LSH8_9BILA|nr:hypothetical protein WR25_06190 [Diploscapter pachys]